MIRIAICDDNHYFIDLTHNLITKAFMDSDFEYQVYEYTSSQSFLNGFHDLLFDIVLLDIEIDEQDGIFLSRKLQNSQSIPHIIFVTSHSSFMKDAFGYHVYKYILKDEIGTVLPETLLSLIKRLEQNNQLILSTEEGKINVSYSDIHYIEYVDRKIYMKYKNQYIQLYISSLKKVLEFINNENFIQVNNRYIINLNYVQSMKEGLIVMDGINIDIPKGKRKAVYQNYQKFILNKYKNV